MTTEIDTRVTPALHSENVRTLDGYSETTAQLMAPVVETMDDVYATIGKLHSARDAAKNNKAWTEGQQVIAIADTALKQKDRLIKKFYATVATLDRQIRYYEAELTQPLESKASAMVAAEIRRHAKELSTGKRQSFVMEAINTGDETTASALLGAPSYLSGLDAEAQRTYTRMWHAKTNPEKETRLNVTRGARALLEDRMPLIDAEIVKAIGADWRRVHELRSKNEKAVAALNI